MRTGTAVYFLYGDHLGSTSLTADGDGDVVPRQLDHPYGTVRWASGTLPTDFTFTGQRNDPSTQLIQMGARWYEVRIGRWVSADTIIPDPTNPQSLNRYSYVSNNPCNLIDPTGYCGEGSVPGEGVSEARHAMLCTLYFEALRLSQLVGEGGITDVEALAMLLDFGAPYYIHSSTFFGRSYIIEVDASGFAGDIGIVVGGNEFYGFGPGTQRFLRQVSQGSVRLADLPRELADAFSYQLLQPNDPDSRFGQYYVGLGAFGSSGFATEYFEPVGNQVRHFLGGLSTYGQGGRVAQWAALYRETPGTPDYRLHEKAFELANDLNVDQAGSWVLHNVADVSVKRQYGIATPGSP